MAIACARLADTACARDYVGRANARVAALRTVFWKAREGRFADLDWRTGQPTAMLSAATLFPLFVGAARPDQARAVGQIVRRRLLAPGGLRATAVSSGQRWDIPNGWAPLQWIAVEGLRRSGDAVLARNIAQRWLTTVNGHYRTTGTLLESYDIERGRNNKSRDHGAHDGIAWTAGITRMFATDFGMPSPN
jgi:alpha,alpha-trehalase